MSILRVNSQLFVPTGKTALDNDGKPYIRYLEDGTFENIALEGTTGSYIELELNTQTYVLTFRLKNASGTVISTANVDFPVESMVVNATYANGILTLILQNGNTVDVDISDIIDGLVTLGTAQTITGKKTFETDIEIERPSGATGNPKLSVYTVYFKNADKNASPTYPQTGFYQWGDEWQVNARRADGTYDHNLFSINNRTNLMTLNGSIKLSGNLSNGTNSITVAGIVAKLDKTGDSKDNTVTFTEASALANVNSGESHATMWGKVKKWFTDKISQLKALAFKDKVAAGDYTAGSITSTDVDSTIAKTTDIPTVNNGTLTIRKNGVDVQTFTANQSSNVIADISVPTKTSDLTNDSNFVTSSILSTELAKKVNDMTIGIYNGTGGNPKPVRFMSVDYNNCGSEEGVFIKVSMVSGHGNGVSYTFLQDAFFNVSYTGTVSVNSYKYFGQAITYNGVARQYGDIFWVIDTTNKVVDFYVLMGQYASVYSSPFKRLNASTKGVITQYTSGTVYSSGTQNWATQGDIARLSDIPDVSNFVDLTSSQTVSGQKSFSNISEMLPVGNASVNLGSQTRRWFYFYCYGISNGTIGEMTSTIINRIRALPSPNLLINSNFAINQRGASSYTGSNVYTVDRWIKSQGSGTITVYSDHIVYSSGGSVLTQYVEDTDALWGKDLTLTYSGNGSTATSWRTCTLPSTKPSADTVFTTESDFPKVGYKNSNGKIYVEFNSGRTLYWVKLEIGSYFTNYVAPSIAEELPKCQRYYQNIRLQGNTIAASTTDTMYPNVKLLQAMRVRPTITTTSYPYVRGHGFNIQATSISVNGLYKDSIQLQVKIGSTNLVANYVYSLAGGDATLDAEIY